MFPALSPRPRVPIVYPRPRVPRLRVFFHIPASPRPRVPASPRLSTSRVSASPRPRVFSTSPCPRVISPSPRLRVPVSPRLHVYPHPASPCRRPARREPVPLYSLSFKSPVFAAVQSTVSASLANTCGETGLRDCPMARSMAIFGSAGLTAFAANSSPSPAIHEALDADPTNPARFPRLASCSIPMLLALAQ